MNRLDAIEATKEALEDWEQRAADDSGGNCALCNFAEEDCDHCPYFIIFGDCTQFEGYKLWVAWAKDKAKYDDRKEQRREGARLAVAKLKELLDVLSSGEGDIEEEQCLGQ